MWSGRGIRSGSNGLWWAVAGLGWLLVVGSCSSPVGTEPAGTEPVGTEPVEMGPAESTLVVVEEAASTTSTVPVSATVGATSGTSTTVASGAGPSSTPPVGVVLPEPVDGLGLADPEAPAPEVDLAAESWAELVGVWSDIDAYWTWLNAHPTNDPDVLAVIFDPDGPEYEEQVAANEAVVEAGLRLVGENAVGDIIGFGCCENPDDVVGTGVVRIVIVSRSEDPAAIVLNEAGEVTEELPGWERMQFTVELRRSQDAGWRIWDFA